MTTDNQILVATDFSEASDEAVRQGGAWALDRGMPLTVCHVLPEILGSNPMFPQRAMVQQQTISDLQQYFFQQIEEQVLRCTDFALGSFEALVEIGVPASVLVRLGQSGKIAGIVVGGKPSAAASLPGIGSTAERVVRYSPVSVLLARAAATASGHVLAATDLSDPAIPVIQAAANEARARSAKLTVLHGLELALEPVLDGLMGPTWPIILEVDPSKEREAAMVQLRSAVDRAGTEAEILCEPGDSAQTILRIAQERSSELIVVGSHGRSNLGQFLLGSVAEQVIRRAANSVLVVRMISTLNVPSE
jgi:nucleotide-binding universal stress UspA family protein